MAEEEAERLRQHKEKKAFAALRISSLAPSFMFGKLLCGIPASTYCSCFFFANRRYV